MPMVPPRHRGKLLQGLAGRGEEQVDHQLLVVADEEVEPVVEGEDDVKVWHGEQLGPAGLEPVRALERTAGRTVRIVTGIPQDLLMVAVVTAVQVATERRSTAVLDGPQDLAMRRRQSMAAAVFLAVCAQHRGECPAVFYFRFHLCRRLAAERRHGPTGRPWPSPVPVVRPIPAGCAPRLPGRQPGEHSGRWI